MSAGRPPIFDSVEALEKKIQEYWESCEVKETENEDTGESTWTPGKQPTITGLAHFLGFESRQSFYDYEEKEEFSYTIKRARLQIESNYEQALFNKNAAGPIFALKNFGWKDKQEIKHEGIPAPFFNLDPLADDPTHHGAEKNSATS